MSVVHLVDRAPVAVNGLDQMRDWAGQWLDALCSGNYGQIRSMTILVESDDGRVATVSQSTNPHQDRARVTGLLFTAAHDRIGAEDLRP
jgi:hypothetical protein